MAKDDSVSSDIRQFLCNNWAVTHDKWGVFVEKNAICWRLY